MVRSCWYGALLVLLAWAGGVAAQRHSAPQCTTCDGHYVVVDEPGKGSQKCRILYCWRMPDGKRACQVQAVDTGEVMTIVDFVPPKGAPELVGSASVGPLVREVYRWGKSTSCPEGFPQPPQRRATDVTTVVSEGRSMPQRRSPLQHLLCRLWPRTNVGPVIVARSRVAQTPRQPRKKQETVVIVEEPQQPTRRQSSWSPFAFLKRRPQRQPQVQPAPTQSNQREAPRSVWSNFGWNTAKRSPRREFSKETVVVAPPPTQEAPVAEPKKTTSRPPRRPWQVVRNWIVPNGSRNNEAKDRVKQPAPPVVPPKTSKPAPVAPSHPEKQDERITMPELKAWPPAHVTRKDSGKTLSEIVASKKPAATPSQTEVKPKTEVQWSEPKHTDKTPLAPPPQVVTTEPLEPAPKVEKTEKRTGLLGRVKKLFGRGEVTKPSPVAKETELKIPSSPKRLVQPSVEKVAEPSKPLPPPPASKVAKAEEDPLANPQKYVALPKPVVDGGKKEGEPTADPVGPLPPAPKIQAPVNPQPRQPVVITRKPEPAAPKTEYREIPPGTQSVLAAQNGLRQPMRYLPVPIVTVPTPNLPPTPPPPQIPQPPQPAMWANAFTPPSSGNSGNMMMPQGYYPPMPGGHPMMMQRPMMPMQGYYPPMANGYPMMRPPMTHAAMYQRQGTPSFPVNVPRTYQGPQPPNPFGNRQVNYWQPATPVSYPAVPPAMAAASNPYHPVSQMLVTLKTALSPSQREWAVLHLARYDWNRHPEVVQGLLVAAQEDPAPSVRAACIRALQRMRVHPTVIAPTLRILKSDKHAVVRQAAQTVLVQMGLEQQPTAARNSNGGNGSNGVERVSGQVRQTSTGGTPSESRSGGRLPPPPGK